LLTITSLVLQVWVLQVLALFDGSGLFVPVMFSPFR
jgi:hypothetical protein